MPHEEELRDALVQIIRGHVPDFDGTGRTVAELEIYIEVLNDMGRLAERDAPSRARGSAGA